MYLVLVQRFQKTYEALEQEGMEEKRQLTAIHQQRVTKELNDKKRVAMEKYMDVSRCSHSELHVHVQLYMFVVSACAHARQHKYLYVRD